MTQPDIFTTPPDVGVTAASGVHHLIDALHHLRIELDLATQAVNRFNAASYANRVGIEPPAIVLDLCLSEDVPIPGLDLGIIPEPGHMAVPTVPTVPLILDIEQERTIVAEIFPEPESQIPDVATLNAYGITITEPSHELKGRPIDKLTMRRLNAYVAKNGEAFRHRSAFLIRRELTGNQTHVTSLSDMDSYDAECVIAFGRVQCANKNAPNPVLEACESYDPFEDE